jgi:hypothetical protein
MSKKFHHRIIPAYHFRAQSLGDGEIEGFVNDILQSIEDDIKSAVENEEKKTRTEIPTTFAVPGMDNKRAQRHVYFHVLRALKRNRYIPRIEIKQVQSDSQTVFVHVTWITKEDREMENYMDKFISAHQINKPELPKPSAEMGTNTLKPVSRRRRGKKKDAE